MEKSNTVITGKGNIVISGSNNNVVIDNDKVWLNGKLMPLSEEWKRSLSEQVDALWAATGNYEMQEWADEVNLAYIHLVAVSEYYTNKKSGRGAAYAYDFVPNDHDFLKAEKVLELGKAFLF
jgi:hypothetical protein